MSASVPEVGEELGEFFLGDAKGVLLLRGLEG